MNVQCPAINGTTLLTLLGLGNSSEEWKEYKSQRKLGERCGMLNSGHDMASTLEFTAAVVIYLHKIGPVTICQRGGRDLWGSTLL